MAIVGHGANGSELNWVEMREGSGHKVLLSEYSAMFSVHDVDGSGRNCRFEDSKVVDDMVHAVYSTVHFKRCTFVRSARRRRPRHQRRRRRGVPVPRLEAGNDGLDLMTSIVVRSTEIEDSGDKGISVGEDTQVFVADSRISGCEIGMQIRTAPTPPSWKGEIDGIASGSTPTRRTRYDSGGFGVHLQDVDQGQRGVAVCRNALQGPDHDCSVERPVGEGPLNVLEGGPRADRSVDLDDVTDIGVRLGARTGQIERFAEEVERVVPLFRSQWVGTAHEDEAASSGRLFLRRRRRARSGVPVTHSFPTIHPQRALCPSPRPHPPTSAQLPSRASSSSTSCWRPRGARGQFQYFVELDPFVADQPGAKYSVRSLFSTTTRG